MDASNVKRVLGQLELDDLQGRALVFLKDPKSFPPGDKSLSVFCMGVNRYGHTKASNPPCSDALRRSLEAAAEAGPALKEKGPNLKWDEVKKELGLK